MMISIAGVGAIKSGAWLEWMNRGAATWPSGSAAGTCSQHVLDPLLLSSAADFNYRYPVGGRMNESDRIGFAAAWSSEICTASPCGELPAEYPVTALCEAQYPVSAAITRPGRSGGIALVLIELIVASLGTRFA